MTGSVFSAFGLHLRLPFSTPLLQEAPDDRLPDITVRWGPTPATLEESTFRGDLEAPRARIETDASGGLLWAAPHTRVWIPDPDNIVVEALQETPVRARKRMILYYCLPAALGMRGLISLHASTALTRGGAVVLVGPSGSGKSTLLAGLLNQGCRMLSDDVSVLRYSPAAGPEVLPGYPTFRLDPDTLGRLAPPAERTALLSGGRKVLVRVPETFRSDQPARVRSIILLEGTARRAPPPVRVRGVSGLRTLQENCYPPVSLRPTSQDIERLASLLAVVPSFRITRSPGVWSVDELVARILKLAGSPSNDKEDSASG